MRTSTSQLIYLPSLTMFDVKKINIYFFIGMSSLVGLSFFFLLVSENMPPSSTVPLIGGYYSVTMIQMGVSFYMNILVLRFHNMTDEMVPEWVRVSIDVKYVLIDVIVHNCIPFSFGFRNLFLAMGHDFFEKSLFRNQI